MFDFDALEERGPGSLESNGSCAGRCEEPLGGSLVQGPHQGWLPSETAELRGADSEGAPRSDSDGGGAGLPSLCVGEASDASLAERACGNYYPCGSLCGRLVFKRTDPGGPASFVYFLEACPRSGPRGWRIGAELGGEVAWADHPDGSASLPPVQGWRVPPGGLADPSLAVRRAPRAGAVGGGGAAPRGPRAGGRNSRAGRAGTVAPPFRCLLYHGTVYLPYMDPRLLDHARASFVLQGRDIVVVSHPRCGTTWCQAIVLNLLHRGRPRRVKDPMMEAPWIEASLCKGRATLEDLSERDGGTGLMRQRCLKTHAPAHLAPWHHAEHGARLVLMTRDPRDAAVSHYHHIINSSAYRFRGSWDDFCGLFLGGLVEGGDFWQWHEGWAQHADDLDGTLHERCLWVRYEDLILDLEGQVRRIASFLGIQSLCREMGVAELTSADMHAVVAAVQFDAMSDLFEKRNARKRARGRRFDPTHIRNGVAGGWAEAMSEGQSRLFCERTRECAAPVWMVPHWEGGS